MVVGSSRGVNDPIQRRCSSDCHATTHTRLHHGFPQTTTIIMQSSHFIVSGFPISEGFLEYHLEQKHLAINLAQIRPQSETKAPAFNCKQTSRQTTNL